MFCHVVPEHTMSLLVNAFVVFILVWQAPGASFRRSVQEAPIASICDPPIYDPRNYHLHLWQSTRNASLVGPANENNLKFLPRNVTIHTLTDDDLAPQMKTLSDKLYQCAGISGAYQAFLDLRPMAYRTDLYRAAQLWDAGGLWLDDKIWLTQNFSKFVNTSIDEILLPLDTGAEPGVYNGFLWSRPRQPVWEHIIQRIVSNVQKRLYFSHFSNDRSMVILHPLLSVLQAVYDGFLWFRPFQRVWQHHINSIVSNAQNLLNSSGFSDDWLTVMSHPWLSVTGPIAYFHGLQQYQRFVATCKAVRRDLRFSRPMFCVDHLPDQFNNHSCDAVLSFAIGPNEQNFGLVHDAAIAVGLAKEPQDHVVAFCDEQDHHAGADSSLLYRTLWWTRRIYCETHINNDNDPCTISMSDS